MIWYVHQYSLLEFRVSYDFANISEATMNGTGKWKTLIHNFFIWNKYQNQSKLTIYYKKYC